MRSGLAMAAFYTHAPHQATAIHYSRPDPKIAPQNYPKLPGAGRWQGIISLGPPVVLWVSKNNYYTVYSTRRTALSWNQNSSEFLRNSRVAWDNFESLALLGMLGTFPHLATPSLDATVFGALIDTAQGRFQERRALIDIDKVLASGLLIVGAPELHRLLVPLAHRPSLVDDLCGPLAVWADSRLVPLLTR